MIRDDAGPELDQLLAIFYARAEVLGRFAAVEPEAMPRVFRELLHHHRHMTVTVEKHHGCAVDVEVLASHHDDQGRYCRKILLRRQTDQAVVQFGIVRLDVSQLRPIVRREIESERIPLGRVLIQHQVLRRVQLAGLWRVEMGPDLARWMDHPEGTETFGRTALIYCDGRPAVELLEIVTP